MYKITCKKCRRLGQTVCGRDNCAIKRKQSPPGQKGKRFRRVSEYGRQLAEKQKLKIIYGLREKQFRNYFKRSDKSHNPTGQILLSLLERRLDNVVYRLGLASTRSQAKQFVGHGHFTVNGRRVTIPSYAVKVGDIVEIRKGSEQKKIFEDHELKLKKYIPPTWIELDKEALKAKIVALPSEDKLADVPVDLAQIVEYYSR